MPNNLKQFPRMAFLVIAGLPALLNAQTPLAYNPVAAEYSTALDRMILVSANPNQLHIYDPASQNDVAVGLPKAPLALSISPDGMYAAVGHDALVSYVSLGAAAVQQTYPVASTPSAVLLGSSRIYVLGSSRVVIDLATGTSAQISDPYSLASGRFSQQTNAVYGISSSSPASLVKYDADGDSVTPKAVAAGDDHVKCGNVWLSADGSRIYNGCGTVFAASTNQAVDGHYVSSLAGVTSVGALAESEALQRVALMELASAGATETANDGVVRLFETPYLQPAGQFVLPNFPGAGSGAASHGRWAFFNSASTALYVLMQADASAGLQKNFAVQKFSMSAPVACGAAFGSSAAKLAGSGTFGTVNVSAAPGCIYQTASDSSWLEVVSGGYGSGNGTLTYLARANSGAARSGTLSINGQAFTVTQDAAARPGAFTQLAYNVVDAAYDKALDKVVLAAANPNELHIYDPVTLADQVVRLALPPLAVSVRPDGLYAAVGHDGWVSYVNLQTQQVEQVYEPFTDVHHLVAAGNGILYLFPHSGSPEIYALDVANGATTVTASAGGGWVPGLYMDGSSIYLGGGEVSKWNIQSAAAVSNGYGIGACDNLWLTEDGRHMFTACGTVYTTSAVPAQDLQYSGRIANAGSSVAWVAESAAQQSTAVIPTDTQIQIYGDAKLSYAGTLPLPQFSTAGTAYPGHGKFVFWNSAGTELYVIEQADSAARLLSSFAVDVIAPSTKGCNASLGSSSASEPHDGGLDSVSLTASPACVYTAASSAPWLTVTAGSFGFGPGTVSFALTPNTTAGARKATLTVAGVPLTVTQAGAPPSVHIDLPAPGAIITGTVTVAGWAIDNATSVGTAINPSSVYVYVDGNAVGTATYGVPRGDVCKAYPGRPGCPDVGFTFQLNTTSLAPGAHTITVSANNTDPAPETGFATVNVTEAGTVGPPTVHIDTPSANASVSGSVTVSGWAIDNAAGIGTAIQNVQVALDGKPVGAATYGVPRSDVCNAYPGRVGCPNVGFTYQLSTATLTAGTHTITVSATDSDTTPDTGTASVTVTVTGTLGTPTVHIDTPAANASVSGMISVAGWAIDNAAGIGTAIQSVQVAVDGKAVGAATYGVKRGDVCNAYPGRPGCPNVGFTYQLNAATLTPGAHTITVSATDSDLFPDTGTATVSITATGTLGPPTVTIDTPAPNATVTGTITLSGWAIDNAAGIGSPLSSVQVKVDGNVVGAAVYGVPRADVCAAYPGRPGCPNVGFTYPLNTAGLTLGAHVITISATDTDLVPDTGSASVTVTVAGNVPGPPTVSITSPAPGASVSGTISVAGWALDNASGIGSAIAYVQVKVDGNFVGTAAYGLPQPSACNQYPGRPGCPNVGFNYQLNTAGLAPGSHTISVYATDTDPQPDTGFASVTVTVP